MKVLKFSATWCGPCKMLQATIDSIHPPVDIQNVDIEEDFEVARQYNIRGVPTLVMLDDSGNEIKRVSGTKTKEQLLEWLNN